MSCLIKDTTAGKFLQKNKIGQTLVPGYFESTAFLEDFGDWTSPDFDGGTRVNEDGSPSIIAGKYKLFYRNVDGKKVPINDKRFKTLLTNDARALITKEVTDILMNDLFRNAVEVNGTLDAIFESDVSLSDSFDQTLDYLKDEVDDGAPYSEAAIEAMESSKDDFIASMKQRLRALGVASYEAAPEDIEIDAEVSSDELGSNQEMVEETDQSEEEANIDEVGTGPIAQIGAMYRKTSDHANSDIKMMLEFLPKYDSNGRLEFTTVFPDIPASLNQSKAWGVLLPALSDIPMGLENNIEVYLDALSKQAVKYPWVENVHTAISKGDQQTHISFIRAFNNVQNAIYTFTYDSGGGIKVIDSANTGTGYVSIGRDWVRMAQDYFYDGHKLSSSKAEAFKNSAKVSRQTIIDKVPEEANTKHEMNNILAELASLSSVPFKKVGIDMNKELISVYYGDFLQFLDKDTTDVSDPVKSIGVFRENLITFLSAKSGIPSIINKDKDKFASDYKARTLNLSKAAQNTGDFMVGHMATVGDKRIYTYSLPSVVQELVNQFKADPSLIKDAQANPAMKNSLVLDAWSKGSQIMSQVKPGIKGVLQKENDSADYADNNSITMGDYLKVDMYSVLRRVNGVRDPIYNTAVPADKGKAMMITLKTFLETNTVNDAVSTFQGYVIDEYQEMVQAKIQVQEAVDKATRAHEAKIEKAEAALLTAQKGTSEKATQEAASNLFALRNTSQKEIYDVASNDLEIGYLLDRRKGEIAEFDITGENVISYKGEAFNFKLFESMGKFEGLFNATGEPTANTFEEANVALQEVSNELSEHILDSLNARVDKFSQEMRGYGISARLEGALPKEIVGKYLTDAKANKAVDPFAEAEANMVRDYVINSIMSKVEYSKLYTGSLQHYKQDQDYIKRVPFTYIDGLQPVVGLTEGDVNFSQMTFSTEGIENSLLDNSDYPMLPEVKKSYGFVDRTDAQAYITPARWKFLIERTGKMNKKAKEIFEKMEKQWKLVEQGKDIPTDMRLTPKEMKILSAQPLKGVYGKNDLITGRPTYLKYSQAVLTPEMASNQPKIRKLLEYMETNNIDEAVADTGVKIGSLRARPLFGENGFLDNPNAIAPEVQMLDNRNWRLQQDLSTKGTHGNKIGTQFQKIVLSGLRYMGDGIINEETGKTATQLADQIESALGDLVDINMKDFSAKYGIKEDGVITNVGEFYSTAIEDLKSDGKDVDSIMEFLEGEYPLGALPSQDSTVINGFLSNLKKAATHLLTDGGALIQMSDQLITKEDIESTTGIRMLIDMSEDSNSVDGRLKPPRVVEENGKIVVKPGQVLVPHDTIIKLLPDYATMSKEDLKKALPEAARKLLGYRIPTQSRASTDTLEIVGILPETMGDTIIAYGEITAKTGSDFDIDKMFFMVKEYELVDGVVTARTDGNAGTRNKAIDLFTEALESPPLYSEMMTSIDNDTTQRSIEAFLPKTEKADLLVFDPLQAMQTLFNLKAGAAGIGTMVNNNNDHIRSETKGLTLQASIGTWANRELDEQASAYLTKEELNGYTNDKGEFVKGLIDYMLEEVSDENRDSQRLILQGTLQKRNIDNVLSELTNAFVDIANKDAFITRANWGGTMNTYGAMLIRAGVHPNKVFLAMQQPIITEMAKQISKKEGKIQNTASWEIRNRLLGEAEVNLIKNYKVDINKDKGVVFEYNAQGKIKGIVTQGELSQMDFHAMMSAAKEGKQTTYKEALNQYIVMKHIIDTSDVAKIFGASVTSAKLGEEAMGKNMGDLMAAENKISFSFTKDDKSLGITGLENKFFDKNGKGTLLMKFYNSTAKYAKDVIDSNPDLFFGFNSGVREELNSIMAAVSKQKYVKDGQVANDLLNQVRVYLLSRSPIFKSPYTEVQREDMMNEVMIMKRDGQVDKENSDTYEILNRLNIFKNKQGRDVFTANKISSLEAVDKEVLTQSWARLIKNEPKIGKFLVQEAYSTYGFRPSPQTFSTLIPPMYLIENGIEADVLSQDQGIGDAFMDQLVRNKVGYDIVNKVMSAQDLIITKDNSDNDISLEVVKSASGGIIARLRRNERLHKLPKYAKGRKGVMKLMGLAKKKVKKDKLTVVEEHAIYMPIKAIVESVYYNTDHQAFLDQVDPGQLTPDQVFTRVMEDGYFAYAAMDRYEQQYVQGRLPRIDLSNMQQTKQETTGAIIEIATIDTQDNNENC